MWALAYEFKIDGITIPVPTEYSFSVEDLSSQLTGRTLDGVMHKDVVAVKDSYTCKWKKLSWEETAILLNAVDGKEKVMFTYADPRVPNQMLTNEFYIGQRTTPVGVIKEEANESYWKDISMTFIRI